MLATTKNVLFPGHNHLLTTSTDDLTLWLSPERQPYTLRAGQGIFFTYVITTDPQARVLGHHYQWLAGGYELEIEPFSSGYHGGYLVDSVGFCAVIL